MPGASFQHTLAASQSVTQLVARMAWNAANASYAAMHGMEGMRWQIMEFCYANDAQLEVNPKTQSLALRKCDIDISVCSRFGLVVFVI